MTAHGLTSPASGGAVQKSEQRPPRSQSPYLVGSGPRGPPISPVALFTCTPPSSSSSSFPASASTSAPLASAASSPSPFPAASGGAVGGGGGPVDGAELESATRRRMDAGGAGGGCGTWETAEARRRRQWLAAMARLGVAWRGFVRCRCGAFSSPALASRRVVSCARFQEVGERPRCEQASVWPRPKRWAQPITKS